MGKEAQAWQDLKQEFLAGAAKIPPFRRKSQFGKMLRAIPPHKGQITSQREMPITRDTPQRRGVCPGGREEGLQTSVTIQEQRKSSSRDKEPGRSVGKTWHL